MQELITMSKQELDRLEIIQQLQLRELKQDKASYLLGISIRQIQRLLHQYRKSGPQGLISKKRGKTSNNKISANVIHQASSIIKEYYPDFGPTLACEKLQDKHNISLSVETVRKIMIDAGIWKTRSQRLKRAYPPRNRRDCYGELIQIDGSSHHWFEGRAGKTTLLVYVDDATSKLMVLHMVPSESTHTYLIATEKYITQYGKPLAFYSDQLSVFRVSHKTTKPQIMTQFGRALYELNIDLICANSCQAKGRVERANKTLQDRLVKELRLRNISTVEEANAYFTEFIEEYNKRFAREAHSPTDAHRSLRKHESLVDTLCFKQERTVSNNLTIQYDRILYMIEDTEENRLLRRKRIMLHEHPDGCIYLYHKDRQLNFRKYYDKVQLVEQGQVVPNKRIDEVIEIMKEHRKSTPLTRSVSCPGKRHLGKENVWHERQKKAKVKH